MDLASKTSGSITEIVCIHSAIAVSRLSTKTRANNQIYRSLLAANDFREMSISACFIMETGFKLTRCQSECLTRISRHVTYTSARHVDHTMGSNCEQPVSRIFIYPQAPLSSCN